MTRPVCTDETCERPVMRFRDGMGWCMFHPDAAPPVIDPKTGRPKVATPLSAAPGPVDDMAELQVELEELERTDPAVAAAAASYDAMVDHVLARPARRSPAPPKPRPARRRKPTPRQVDVAYDQAAELVLHVERTRPPAPREDIDPADIARRYLAGEGLYELTRSLQIGVKALRALLDEQGVERRKRGHVPLRALVKGRRGRGVELNDGYYADGVRYLRAHDAKVDMPSLFDLEDVGGAA